MVLFKKVKVTLTFLRKKHILRFKNTGACSPPNTKKILFETLFNCTTGNAWKLVTKTIHPVHGSVSRYGPRTSCQSKVPTIVKIPNFFSLFSYVSFSLYFFFFFWEIDYDSNRPRCEMEICARKARPLARWNDATTEYRRQSSFVYPNEWYCSFAH